MIRFKIGDKVTLNCSVEEFKFNVGCGKAILEENFSADLIATVKDVNKYRIELSEVVSCSGECTVDRRELQYLKLADKIEPVTVQTKEVLPPKIVQILDYGGDLLGLGEDGVVYINIQAKWEVYSYNVF